jgi:isocitrate dehydrogenase (NAD+)
MSAMSAMSTVIMKRSARVGMGMRQYSMTRVAGTQYGGRHTATLIPGDGIGREMTDAVRTVFKAANAPVEWETVHLIPHPDSGVVDLNKAYQSLRRNKVGLKGM